MYFLALGLTDFVSLISCESISFWDGLSRKPQKIDVTKMQQSNKEKQRECPMTYFGAVYRNLRKLLLFNQKAFLQTIAQKQNANDAKYISKKLNK